MEQTDVAEFWVQIEDGGSGSQFFVSGSACLFRIRQTCQSLFFFFVNTLFHVVCLVLRTSFKTPHRGHVLSRTQEEWSHSDTPALAMESDTAQVEQRPCTQRPEQSLTCTNLPECSANTRQPNVHLSLASARTTAREKRAFGVVTLEIMPSRL